MTAKKKGTGTQILRCARLAEPEIQLGTEKISWQRIDRCNDRLHGITLPKQDYFTAKGFKKGEMGILSMLQEVLSMLEVIIRVSAVMILAIVIWGLMIYAAGILLDLLLGIVLCVLEHILPDNQAARKDNHPHRIPEAPLPTPTPSIVRCNLSINKTQKPIQEEIEECLRSMNDEQVHAG